jgi:uncharacterized membrane protein
MRTYGMLLVGVLVASGLPGNDCPAAAITSILYQVSHIKKQLSSKLTYNVVAFWLAVRLWVVGPQLILLLKPCM